MIKIKLEKKKVDNPICILSYDTLDSFESRFLRRVLMDSKKTKEDNEYIVPVKYIIPIINNLQKDRLEIDSASERSFLEFSDSFDEKYYYTFETTPKYMKKWREENCPDIFKIVINAELKKITKEVIFKRIKTS